MGSSLSQLTRDELTAIGMRVGAAAKRLAGAAALHAVQMAEDAERQGKAWHALELYT